MSFDRKIESLNRTVKADPDNAKAKEKLLNLYQRLGYENLFELAKQNPNDIYIGQSLVNVIIFSRKRGSFYDPIPQECNLFDYFDQHGFQNLPAFERAAFLALVELNSFSCIWRDINGIGVGRFEWLNDSAEKFAYESLMPLIDGMFHYFNVQISEFDLIGIDFGAVGGFDFVYRGHLNLVDSLSTHVDRNFHERRTESHPLLENVLRAYVLFDIDLIDSPDHQRSHEYATIESNQVNIRTNSGWRLSVVSGRSPQHVYIEPPDESYIMKNILLR